jgi:hypothetical protein
MARKICPTCKTTQECTLIDEGFRHNIYKCTNCTTEFEKDGTGKKIMEVGGFIFGLALTALGIDGYNDRHSKS